MITDPWEHMILSIEPSYGMCKDAIKFGPRYVPVLTNINDEYSWKFSIDEQWPDEIKYGTIESGKELDIRCYWCDTQLGTWCNVSRQSWQSWHFKNQKDAEKFVTLFNIVWPQ